MDFTFFRAGTDDDGRRVDRIIRSLIPGLGLSALNAALRKGLVRVNGKRTRADGRARSGDEIAVAALLLTPGAPPPEQARAAPKLERVVFRNRHLLVLDKPYDVPVQPGAGGAGVPLSELVEREFRSRGGSGSLSFRTGPLHRLDRKTTGLVVFSQSIDGARIFSRWLRLHALEKIYVGLALGRMERAETWTDRIEKGGMERAFRTVRVLPDAGGRGKRADTLAAPLAHGSLRGRGVTLVRFSIGSGRTHQIRSQAGAHGFPLLGDRAYGGGADITLPQDFFLHAHELRFPDGEERALLGLPERLSCRVPPEFARTLGECRMDAAALPEGLMAHDAH